MGIISRTNSWGLGEYTNYWWMFMGFIYKRRSIPWGGPHLVVSLRNLLRFWLMFHIYVSVLFQVKQSKMGLWTKVCQGDLNWVVVAAKSPQLFHARTQKVRWTQQPRSTRLATPIYLPTQHQRPNMATQKGRVRSSQTTGLIVGDSVEF